MFLETNHFLPASKAYEHYASLRLVTFALKDNI